MNKLIFSISSLMLITFAGFSQLTGSKSVIDENRALNAMNTEEKNYGVYLCGGKSPSLIKAVEATPRVTSSHQNVIGFDGTYHIGVGKDYSTITAAFTALNAGTFTGPVTFLLDDATYPSETYPLVISANSSASAINTLTIKPNTGVSPVITGSLASLPLIRILNNYTTIDGSNEAGGTTRNLTISNISATNPNILLMGSTGATALLNCTVKNTILINGSKNSSGVVISDATTVYNPGTFNNIVIQNNSIQLAYNGIYCIANPVAGNGSGLLITGNDMNTAGNNSIRLCGVYVQGVDGVTVLNNNIGNIANSNTESPRAIWIGTATKNATVSGNTISNISLTNTGAYAISGIYINSGATATSINITNNTVQTLTCSGTHASFAGIISFTPNTNITNNVVTGLTQNSSTYFWGIMQTGAVNSTLSGNTVSELTTSSTGTATGLNVQGASTEVTISKNKIFNIKNTNSAGYAAIGLLLSSTSTNANIVVSNNLVYDVAGYGYGSTTSRNGYGMQISSGGGYKLYYNTVRSATNQTISTGYPAAMYITSGVTTASSLDIRNNIFSFDATSGTYRIAFNCRASNTVFSNLNYNDYFSSGAYFGYFGSTAYSSITSWRVATGQDANSVSTDPQFNSTADLRLLPLSPLLGAGTTISEITTDFLEVVRNSPPTIGAYENGIDVTAPTISYTPLGTTNVLTNRILVATITDYSGVPVSGTGLPVLYWKINTGAWNAATAVSLGASQYQFTFGSGASLGDVISYYIVAQDVYLPAPVAGCYPAAGASGFTIDPPAATTPPTTPSTYNIMQPICGTFNVGVGQTYTTLTAAINDLNSKVITCPVIFVLQDATYSAETFPITIHANIGSSATNTVTIKPATGITPTISGSSASSLIKFNGARYMTIEGSNNSGTDRNLTLTNTATSGTKAVIWVGSTGTAAGSAYITIRNCNLSCGFNISASYGIFAGSSATIGTSGDDNDNLTIENNNISKCYFGIYALASATGMNDNLAIRNNLIGSVTASSYIGCTGIFVSGATAPEISGNEIFNIISSANINLTGIDISGNVATALIKQNKIHDLQNNTSSNYGCYGINFSSNTALSEIQIINNVIYKINNSNYFSFVRDSNPFGIRVGGGAGHKIYFNSISLSGDQLTSGTFATVSAALYITSSSVTGMDIRNNIFTNSIVGLTGSKSYGIYAVSGTTFSSIDYNDYNGSGAFGILGYLGSDKTTIANWRTATSQDLHSTDADPQLNSTSELMPEPGSPVLNAGITISGITTDFLNSIRNSPPSIGAYENGGDVAGPGIVYTPLEPTNLLTSRTLTATLTDYTGVPVSGIGLPVLYWKVNSGVWIASTGISIGANQYQFSFGSGVVPGDIVSYYIAAQDISSPEPLTSCFPPNGAGGFSSNPPTAAIPPVTPSTYNILFPFCGTYNVGVGQAYTTLTAAINALNTKALSCPVTFVLTDATYPGETFPIIINANLGSSPVNTVTIKPAANVNTNISGTSSTALIKFNGASYMTIDGSNNGGASRNLSITNTATSGTKAIIWAASNGNGAGSNYITVQNCNLANGYITSGSYGIFAGASASIGTSGSDNDHLTILNNSISKCYIGVYALASESGLNDSLVIKNNLMGSNTPASYISFEGIKVSGANAPEISGNEIYNIITSSSVNIAGIEISSNVTDALIKQNKVHDLQSNSAYGYGAYGINLSSSTAMTGIQIINNLIYKVNTINYTTGASDYNPYGIRISGGTGHKLYYNSINLYGNQFSSGSSGTLSASVYITSASVTGIDIRNNVFANGIEGLPGSTSYAIYAPYNYTFGTIDYNVYYGYGTYGILGFMDYGCTTMAAWQAATGQDFHSFVADPQFTSPSDFRLKPASPLLGAGISISGVTDDFMNTLRNTPPSIGAYENAGPVIEYTLLENTPTTSERTLIATITDHAGMPVSGIGLPVLYWKINSGIWNEAASLFIGGTQYQFTFGSGVAPGDIVSYYVVAQDNDLLNPMVSCYPEAGAATFTVNPPAVVTPPSSPSTYNILLPMCGTLNVGVGQTYTTLTAAVNDLNSKVIACPVTFVLTDANYAAESFPIVINANYGSSATNTVTFKPAPGVTPLISGASATSLIKFNGANYMTIDGSNSGGNDKSLTLTNTSTTGNTAVVWVGSLGTGNGAKVISVKNCKISNGFNSGNSVGIFAGSATSIGTAGDDNDTLTISNNNIKNSGTGIYICGNETGPLNNLQIIANSIESETGNYMGQRGIIVAHSTGSLISQNSISNLITYLPNPVGIVVSTGVVSTIVERNNISNIQYAGTDGYGARGLDINTSSESDLTIANNVVCGIMGVGSKLIDSAGIVGIMIHGTTSGINLYYNSVNLTGTIPDSPDTSFSTAFWSGPAVTNIIAKDNIFVNTIIKDNSDGSRAFAIYNAGTTGAFTSINNNDYVTSGSQGVLGYLNGEKSTLALWQGATGQDAQSISLNPQFNGPLNLRPTSGSPVIGAGSGIPGITIDILNSVRNSPPSIGAYENSGDAIGPVISYVPLGNTTSTSGRTLIATIVDNTGVPTTGPGLPVVYWKINAGIWNSVTGTSTGSDQYQFLFGDGVVNGDQVSYYIMAQDNGVPVPLVSANPSDEAGGFTFNPPAASTPPSIPNKYTVGLPLSGIKTIGAGGDYPSLTGANGLFEDINNKVLSGNLTAIILSDLTEDGSNDLKQWNEEAPGNFTLTIQPGAATERMISGSVANGMIRLNGADRVIINGRYNGLGKYLRFRNSNPTNPAFVFLNDATTNTIEFCFIEGENKSDYPFSAGLILFSGTNGLTGNDNNLISNNIIRNRTDNGSVPKFLIYSYGTTQKGNSAITITNNELFNFDLSGIYVTPVGNGDGWLINDNSLYMPLVRFSSDIQVPVNFKSGSNGNTISGNYIGGQAPLCGGGYWNNTGTYSFYGINVVAGNLSPTSVQNNAITNIKTSNMQSDGSFRGISAESGWVNIGSVTGNTIGSTSVLNSIIHSGKGSASAIRVSCKSKIANNVIGNVVVDNITDCKNDVGIRLSGDYSIQVENNKIKNIGPSSTAFNTDGLSWPTCGIIAYSLGNMDNSYSIINNDISLGFENYRYNIGMYGIWLAADTGTYHVYYNSINIGGVSNDNDYWDPTTSFSTSAFLIGLNSLDPDTNGYKKTPTVFSKNNIFENNRTNGYNRNAANLSFTYNRLHYSITSDFNDLYRENPPLGYTKDGYVQTLYSWQNHSSEDIHSTCADPMFNDSLNLIPIAGSPVLGEGTPISGIVTDILGNSRNALNPSIGAYEFPGDFHPPVILYTPLVNTASLDARILVATITDIGSGIPTSGIGLPVLYWKVNAGNWNSSTAEYLVGNQFQFTFGNGVVLGDIVSYYVVAQDANADTIQVSCNPAADPAGLVYDPPAAIAPPTTPNIYTIKSPICGILNVGVGQTYTTLTSAINDLNSKIISCPVVFVLKDANYPSETFPIIINTNLGSSAVNTVTIKPATGVITTISGSSSTSIFKFNGASYMTLDGSNSGGSDQSLTILNTSESYNTAGIWVGSNGPGLGSAYITIKNCKLSNGSNTINNIGILSSASSGVYNEGSDNDNLTIQNNQITKSGTGIFIYGPVSGSTSIFNNLSIKNNTIGSNTSTNYIGYTGINIYGASAPEISGNEIFNIISPDYTYGIIVQFNTSGAIIKQNKIHDLQCTTINNEACGIYVNAWNGTTNNTEISNNIIYKINTGNTASYSCWGIYLDEGTGHKVYYNSVSLSGSQSPVGNLASVSAALKTNSANGLVVKNNIFSNGIVGLSGSKAYGIYANYSNFDTIDYNNYYGYGPYGILGFYNSDITSIDAWRTATSMDFHSIHTDPQLNSSTILQPLPGSPVIGAGVTIPGITNDFNNSARNSPPSIGAYENGLDASGPKITYIPLANTNLVTSRILTATITDYSGVPVSGIGLPVLYWKINAGAWNAATAVSIGGTLYQFTFGSGVSLGNVVSYYVAAQDNGLPVSLVSCYPSDGAGGFIINPPVVTIAPTTPSSYTIMAPICGNFNVGTGQTYPTITAAVADLNAKVITCPVTFSLTDAAYPSETLPIVLNANPGSNSTNTVTIKPAPGVNPVISGSSTTSVIKFNGSRYMIIDGSNTGGTDRSLTVSNTSTTGTTAAVWIGSNGTSSGSGCITIKNCNLSNGFNTTGSYGVFCGSSLAIGTVGDDNDQISILNNSIYKSRYGIYASASWSGPNDSLVINNNLIGANVPSDHISMEGIYLNGANAPVISGNEIFNIVSTTNPNSYVAGIGLYGTITDAVIEKNKIHDLSNNSAGSGYYNAGVAGIRINSTESVTLMNNVLFNINTANYSGVNTYGIYIQTGSGHMLYYNSVNLSGYPFAAGSNATTSAALYAGGGYSMDVRNNVFSNGIIGLPGSKAYAIQAYQSNNFSMIDYNNYFAYGPYGILGNIQENGLEIQNIADWRNVTGKDDHSINADPLFAGNSDLRPDFSSPMLGAATVLGAVPNDYLNVARSITAPTIGAYENGLDATGPVITLTSLGNTSQTTSRTLVATITDYTGVPVSGSGLPVLYWKINAGMYNSSPANYLGGDQYSFAFGAGVDMNDTVTYYIVAQDNDNPDNLVSASPSTGAGGFTTNPPACSLLPSSPYSYRILPVLVGPVTIGTGGTYPSLTGTGGLFAAINASVLNSNLVATIISDLTEDGTHGLNQWFDEPAGSYFTLTIQPDNFLRTIASSTVDSGRAMIRIQGADQVTIDGGAAKKLLFRNTNTTAYNTGSTFLFDGGCVNDYLKNCIIENNSTSWQSGNILLSGPATNLVISNNDIHDATGGTTGLPNFAIISNSNTITSTGPVTISNNNISNFSSYGIYLYHMANGCTISGNSLYFNSATSALNIYSAIYLQNGNNHAITGNYIGGQEPLCGGAALVHTGTSSFSGISVYVGASAATSIQGNTIQNISFSGVSSFQGIHIYQGLVRVGTVAGNVIGSQSAPQSITFSNNPYSNWSTINGGIVNAASSAASVYESNIIANISFSASNGSTDFTGIYMEGGGSVKKNKVYGITSTTAGLIPVFYGIRNYGSGDIREFSNNLISLNGGISANPELHAYWESGYNSNSYLYYNNFSISGSATTSSNTYAFYAEGNPSCLVKNNIISNTRASGGSGKHYSTYINTSFTGTWVSDNNDLFSAAGPLGYYLTDQVTMASWKTATGGDASSQNADPQFISSTDLHSLKPELNNGGVAVAGLSTDFSGIVRSNPPDIGAYEFTLPMIAINTLAATGIGKTSAIIRGNINTNNESATMSFDFGLTPSYGSSIAGIPSNIRSLIATTDSTVLTDLTPNTSYYYRIKGVSATSAETGYGLEMSFVTLPDPTISGPVEVNAGSTGNVYFTEPGKTGYAWTVSSGGVITAGGGPADYTATITWNTSGAQSVGVNYKNSAGFPAPLPAILNVTVTSSIPSVLALSGIIVGNGQTFCYNALQTITVAGSGTTFTVQNGGSAMMIAGQKISYLPGTTVEYGGYLSGRIAPAGPFCMPPAMPASITKADEISNITEHSSIKVYPNPTTGKFMIELTGELLSEKVSVDIYGMWGEKVQSSDFTGFARKEFSLSDKPAGVYFIRIISGSKTEVFKIIRK